jgi:hypothetical protein
LLIEYPLVSAQGLRPCGSEIKDIAASEASGALLAAVIGNVDADKAQALLKEALQ